MASILAQVMEDASFGYNQSSEGYEDIDSYITAEATSLEEFAQECDMGIVQTTTAFAHAQNAILLEALYSNEMQQIDLSVAMEGFVGDLWVKLKTFLKRAWKAIQKFARKVWGRIRAAGRRIHAFFGKYGNVLRDKRCEGLYVKWIPVDLARGMQQCQVFNTDIENILSESGAMFIRMREHTRQQRVRNMMQATTTLTVTVGGITGNAFSPEFWNTIIGQLSNLKVRLAIERAIYGIGEIERLASIVHVSGSGVISGHRVSGEVNLKTYEREIAHIGGNEHMTDSGRYLQYSHKVQWDEIKHEALRIADLGSIEKIVHEFNSICSREEKDSMDRLNENARLATDRADESALNSSMLSAVYARYREAIAMGLRAKMNVYRVGIESMQTAAELYLKQSVEACKKAIWYKGTTDAVAEDDGDEIQAEYHAGIGNDITMRGQTTLQQAGSNTPPPRRTIIPIT